MKNKYADIIIDISHEKVDRSFQYEVPVKMQDRIRLGMQVKIPFGNGDRTRSGYVVALSDEASYDPAKIKKILAIPDTGVTIESKLIELASWIRINYGSTMIQALKTVLPIKEKARHKEIRKVLLVASQEEAGRLWQEARDKKHAAKARLLEHLIQSNELPYTEVTQRLKVAPAVLQKFAEQGILRISSETIYRSPIKADKIRTQMTESTPQQKEVLAGILKEWSTSQPRTCLIHGITGSGKTHIYIELIEHVIAKGKQAIVLIPEIALTYQTVLRFYQRFGDKIAVIHSRMSHGERSDSFEQARKGKIQVMIGPRSALFTPFPRLGLIIIDEEHEHTYKSEGTPRYHARETAIARGEIEDARVVLGSATPSVDAYYRAQIQMYALFSLDERYGQGVLPRVYTVDLREELKEGNTSILSRKLEAAIEMRLKDKQQIMLFLNRRGYAGFVSCRSCGYVVKCPHCDVTLSLHNNGKMICHYCGYERKNVFRCPECDSPYIGGFRAGTQQIEEIVKQRFPKARVLRMDMDTTQKKDGHTKILSAFANQQADILIGTQMIVKGHDFPNVTLVGVLAADLSLYAQDYRAAERTFQLLVQAVGRAGRGSTGGEAIVQTYHPEHYSIAAAKTQDYKSFYEEEIGFRMLMGYPPVAQMMAVMASGEEEQQLAMAMGFLKKYIIRVNRQSDLKIIGPADASVAKVNDRYRKVLYVKHDDYNVLISIRDALERYIEVNSGFSKLYIQFDFNM